MNKHVLDAEMLLTRYRASLEALRSLAEDVVDLVESANADERKLAAYSLRRALAACARAAGDVHG